ncbi:MAG: class I SAM-dependent methyltransferase [Christensenellaceae bacterium]|jgi:SAM-dependent methyltransferase|nr:class I SAM-dependent methyltransferase [Christensenellaceae bacterium]
MDYTKINAETIDKWVIDGWKWGIPVSAKICELARSGEWSVYLTPTRIVPKEWFPSLKGKKLLGLASGGGQQMPIFSIVGADCTVLDYSEKQLESERIVSEREGYIINIIKADMSQFLPFDDCSFDIIFHPVSNIYIENVHHVWRECYRILKHNGILLAGLDNGFNFLFDSKELPLTIKNKLPFNPLKNQDLLKKLQNDNNGIQFSHTFDEQIGGQLKAGFVITDAYEDYESETGSELPNTASFGIPTFWATKAIKH